MDHKAGIKDAAVDHGGGDHITVKHDAWLGEMYERISKRRGSGCETLVISHEISQKISLMLSRNEPYIWLK